MNVWVLKVFLLEKICWFGILPFDFMALNVPAGQLFPPSVAEHFTEKTNDLAQLLTRQIEAFEKEEAALKVGSFFSVFFARRLCKILLCAFITITDTCLHAHTGASLSMHTHAHPPTTHPCTQTHTHTHTSPCSLPRLMQGPMLYACRLWIGCIWNCVLHQWIRHVFVISYEFSHLYWVHATHIVWGCQHSVTVTSLSCSWVKLCKHWVVPAINYVKTLICARNVDQFWLGLLLTELCAELWFSFFICDLN